MILSRSKQYALLAMIELGKRPPGEYLLCRRIARDKGIPFHYLCKLMQQMVNAGLVEAARGRSGGYRLAVPPARISIREVMRCIDGGQAEQECLLGLKACSDDNACAVHCQWRPVKESLLDLLEQQTVAGLDC
ncbi:MAG: Rrf2 family transcriptional regulator [Pseudomonadota bacterium]